MDSVRPTSGASRRTGSLLALALAAAVVVPGLTPATANLTVRPSTIRP